MTPTWAVVNLRTLVSTMEYKSRSKKRYQAFHCHDGGKSNWELQLKFIHVCDSAATEAASTVVIVLEAREEFIHAPFPPLARHHILGEQRPDCCEVLAIHCSRRRRCYQIGGG